MLPIPWPRLRRPRSGHQASAKSSRVHSRPDRGVHDEALGLALRRLHPTDGEPDARVLHVRRCAAPVELGARAVRPGAQSREVNETGGRDRTPKPGTEPPAPARTAARPRRCSSGCPTTVLTLAAGPAIGVRPAACDMSQRRRPSVIARCGPMVATLGRSAATHACAMGRSHRARKVGRSFVQRRSSTTAIDPRHLPGACPDCGRRDRPHIFGCPRDPGRAAA